MISNLQIFIVGVPILVILGSDPQASFFVRSVVVWMNDFAVVTLIFGNLIYSVHWDPEGSSDQDVKATVGSAIKQFTRSVRLSSGRFDSSADTGPGSYHSRTSGHFDLQPSNGDARRSRPRSSFSYSEPQDRIPPMILEGRESEERSKVWSAVISNVGSEIVLGTAGETKTTDLRNFDALGGIDETSSGPTGAGPTEATAARDKDILRGCTSSSLPSSGTFNSEEFVGAGGDGDCGSCCPVPSPSSKLKPGSEITAMNDAEVGDDGHQSLEDETKQSSPSPSIVSSRATTDLLPSVKPNQISPTNLEQLINPLLGSEADTKVIGSNGPLSALTKDSSYETLQASGTISSVWETTAKSHK